MGFLSNFVNGAMNAGFNIAEGAVNSAVSAHYSKSLMKYQSKLNRKDHEWGLLNSPTFQRQGLVDAGYNPILAFGQNTPSMGHVGLLGASAGSPGSGKAFMESQQLDNAKNQLKVQQEYNKNVVANQRAEIENKKAQTQILKAEADEKKRANLVNEGISQRRFDLDFFKSVEDAYMQYRAQEAARGQGSISIPGVAKLDFSKNVHPDDTDDHVRFLESLLEKYGYKPTPKASFIKLPPGTRSYFPESIQPVLPGEGSIPLFYLLDKVDEALRRFRDRKDTAPIKEAPKRKEKK